MTASESHAPALTIVPGPWTAEARHAAVDRESRESFIAYFDRGRRNRNWSPWHDLPLDEVQAYGKCLSTETVDIMEGFLGIEEYIGDFMRDGLDAFRDKRTRRDLHLQWGAEEMRHGAALEQVLLHSGARTEAQLTAFLAAVAEQQWSYRNHVGVDGPLGAIAYATVQERATYINYEQLRQRVRAEYGLPPRNTPLEAERGQQLGAAAAIHLIAHDEIAHHGMFLRLFQIYQRYFPEAATEKLGEVLHGFRMPALRLIPNRRAFLRAMTSARLYDADTFENAVRLPLLRALGLEASFGRTGP